MKYPIRIFTTLFFFIHLFDIYGQTNEKHAKAKIDIRNKSLKELSRLGLETDHGQFIKNRHLISDFSMSELKMIGDNGFDYEILIDDVSSYYGNKNRPSEVDPSALSYICDGISYNFDYKTPVNYKYGSMGGYLTYSQLLSQLDSMHLLYPHLISPRELVDTIHTHDGNQLFYLRLSNDSIVNPAEPKVLYTALHHAREANSLSQMVFYMWYLLENYETDNIVKSIVDKTQLYFIPVINPDGYIINQTNNPQGGGLWRKNAYRNESNELKGVDLNRNYGFFWGYNDTGSSTNPNSQTYRGLGAFSEPETQAIRNFCQKNDFKIVLNYHTAGNYLIHPWGYEDGPTWEDKVFKSMGKVMINENRFKLGTALETVNYTVNGDSDDWFYGDTLTKNKIYAMTPEVGYSFWPSQADIDYLNKSCVWMNHANALLTLSYYDASSVYDKPYLTADNMLIPIKITRSGLKDGSATISLISMSNGCQVITSPKIIDLELGRDTIILFELSFSPNITSTQELDFIIQSEFDDMKFHKDFTVKYIPSNLNVIYSNDVSDISDFETLGTNPENGWALTTETFISSPTSMTDSPFRPYEKNSNLIIQTKAKISLKNIESAFLEFDAKWEIEDGYDYVLVSASKEDQNFIPLCGIYSSIGGPNQILNTPLYDGNSDWVHEIMDLSSFVGADDLFIKFEFVSDDFNEADGFYFDNLEVKVTNKTSSVENEKDEKLYPNIVSAGQQIKIEGASCNTGYLTDIYGIQHPINFIDSYFVVPDHLKAGVYCLTLCSPKKVKPYKIVITN